MNYLTDIAFWTRKMENKEAKAVVVKNWDKVVEISTDDEKSKELLDLIIAGDKKGIEGSLHH